MVGDLFSFSTPCTTYMHYTIIFQECMHDEDFENAVKTALDLGDDVFQIEVSVLLEI